MCNSKEFAKFAIDQASNIVAADQDIDGTEAEKAVCKA